MSKSNLISMPRLSAIAGAVLGLSFAAASQAAGTIEFDNGAKFNWKGNLTYTLASRLKSPDPLLGSDGNKNFDKGALTSNRLGLLFESTLSKDKSGFVLSGSTFYDDVYHRSTDNRDALGTTGRPGHFNSRTKRYHGGYSRILDAYAYTSFGVGDGDATVRLGSHVVSWGESLFFPGISLAQGPADGTKSDVPGTETKDLLLPEDQLSLIYRPTADWALKAHWQYGWHETIAPAPGSFMSDGEAVGPGASCLGPYVNIPAVPGMFEGYNGCSFGNRQADNKPKKGGQWGVGTTFRVTDETEVGLYYLNYHDRVPLPEVNVFTPGVALPDAFGGGEIGMGSYRIRYFDNIKLLGASFTTSLGMATLAGEISYKKNAPALVDAIVDPMSGEGMASPTRARIVQTNLNTFINYGRTAIADGTLVLAEMSYVDVSNAKKIKVPGVEAMGEFADFFPASNKLSFGGHGLAMSGMLVLTYYDVFSGWDLDIPISYEQQLSGRTLVGGVGGEGDRRFSIGASLTYNQNLELGLTYTNYLGDAHVRTLKREKTLTDRDNISFVVKYSF
ncbi:MAG: DUF1302 family protein [Thauera sp.]|jgi:hypothetical protein|nr:DUF1302 family protein [Thauera sp.]